MILPGSSPLCVTYKEVTEHRLNQYTLSADFVKFQKVYTVHLCGFTGDNTCKNEEGTSPPSQVGGLTH